MKKQIQHSVMALLIFTIASAFIIQTSKWTAPVSAGEKKNPISSDETSIAAGKAVYSRECSSCHGKKGKGDGPASIALSKPAGDMGSKATLSQSDGALFWKIAEGNPPMPSFKKQLKDEQIWQVINYIRTFNSTSKK